ncbi:MAG TPA: TIGR01777 family oxidoreductase [Acidiferrobacterales bacterium]|jgi:uncharacterized protein (TIGR01777 family)
MNTLTLALNLLVIQGALGAVDTLYHHELRAALPQQPGAAVELRIHALRSLLYGLLFAGLAWFDWGGAWLIVPMAVLLVEVVLTLWDFLVEDRSRLLPRSERVLHTLLAINGGAVFALLALHAPHWWALPTGLHRASHGWLSVAFSLFAAGVTASGIRDAIASRRLRRRAARGAKIRFTGGPRRVLVTGGTGFIGQALCRALLAEGHELTLLTRDPLRASYLFDGRARCIHGLDELDRRTPLDVVINLAGERIVGPRWTATRKHKLIASRIDTTRALVEWIARARSKPRLMISASAVGYYGVQAPEDPGVLNENTASQPVFVSELCQRWEAAARTVTDQGVPLALLRFGLVFGDQGILPAMRLPFLLGLGGRIGKGRHVISWVHIDDVIGAIAHLMNNPDPKRAHGVYNVTAPQPITQAEFAATLARTLRRPAWLVTPAALLRLLLGEQATLMVDGQRAHPTALVRAGYRFRFPRLDAALEDLHGAAS